MELLFVYLLLTHYYFFFFFYRFKWKKNGQTDLPYANPFTISTIPALSGATVDKLSKPTTVNSKMVCKQLIIILKVKYDIPNVSTARYDIFLKRKILYFFLLYLLSIRYHASKISIFPYYWNNVQFNWCKRI